MQGLRVRSAWLAPQHSVLLAISIRVDQLLRLSQTKDMEFSKLRFSEVGW